jgi:imidazolonepropionase
MTPAEILTAVTLNGACAIGRGGKTGTLEPGKQGDLVLWDAPDMEFLCYRFGSNLVHRVVKEGRVLGKETK